MNLKGAMRGKEHEERHLWVQGLGAEDDPGRSSVSGE